MYNAENIMNFYDEYGIREWERMDKSAYDRINFYLHMHFAREHITGGKRILDAGCGAGRYSIEFARLGNKVTLFDISQGQLDIAREQTEKYGVQDNIEEIVCGDLLDLSAFDDNLFDTVVCYGAPLNYVVNNYEKAISELARVTKVGGTILLSVCNKWGVFKYLLGSDGFDLNGFFGAPDYWFIDKVIETGDLPAHEKVEHPPRHFFDSVEMKLLLEKAGFGNLTMGGSPCFTCGFRKAAETLNESENAWRTILRLEEQAYCQPGMIDSGEFLLASGTKL